MAKAHGLVLEMYKITKNFPVDEKFRLTSQILRSSSSIPTNIVEGFKRKTTRDKSHFINLSESSLEETKYHIILARDLGYLDADDFDRLNILRDEVGRMLCGFNKRLCEKGDGINE